MTIDEKYKQYAVKLGVESLTIEQKRVAILEHVLEGGEIEGVITLTGKEETLDFVRKGLGLNDTPHY